MWFHVFHGGGGGGLVAKSFQTLATPWTVTLQVPLSMGFSRQEDWSGLQFSFPGDLPDPGIELLSPVLQAVFFIAGRFLVIWATKEALCVLHKTYKWPLVGYEKVKRHFSSHNRSAREHQGLLSIPKACLAVCVWQPTSPWISGPGFAKDMAEGNKPANQIWRPVSLFILLLTWVSDYMPCFPTPQSTLVWRSIDVVLPTEDTRLFNIECTFD